MKKLLLTGLLGLSLIGNSCKFQKESIVLGDLKGKVINEKFTEGETTRSRFLAGTTKLKDPANDKHTMLVKYNNGEIYSYSFNGLDATNMDLLYDVNSEVNSNNLPKKDYSLYNLEKPEGFRSYIEITKLK